MHKKKRRPARGDAVEKPKKTYVGQVSSTARPLPSNPPITHPLSTPGGADGFDLPALRLRLVGVRRRLLERLAADWSDDRRFPDSAWTKLLADVHGAIQALNAQVADDGGAP